MPWKLKKLTGISYSATYGLLKVDRNVYFYV